MIKNNALDASRFFRLFEGTTNLFSTTSTDKAANPVNVMGGTKKSWKM